MPNLKISQFTNLAGLQVPTDVVPIVVGSAAPNYKLTLNDLFSDIAQNVTSKGIAMTGVATGSAPSVSGASQAKFYYDTTLSKWMLSRAAGAYQQLIVGSPSFPLSVSNSTGQITATTAAATAAISNPGLLVTRGDGLRNAQLLITADAAPAPQLLLSSEVITAQGDNINRVTFVKTDQGGGQAPNTATLGTIQYSNGTGVAAWNEVRSIQASGGIGVVQTWYTSRKNTFGSAGIFGIDDWGTFRVSRNIGPFYSDVAGSDPTKLMVIGNVDNLNDSTNVCLHILNSTSATNQTNLLLQAVTSQSTNLFETKTAANVKTLQISTAGILSPGSAGGVTLGTNALPFSSFYLGNAATNNIQLTGTATAARVATFPDATGTLLISSGGNAVDATCNGTVINLVGGGMYTLAAAQTGANTTAKLDAAFAIGGVVGATAQLASLTSAPTTLTPGVLFYDQRGGAAYDYTNGYSTFYKSGCAYALKVTTDYTASPGNSPALVRMFFNPQQGGLNSSISGKVNYSAFAIDALFQTPGQSNVLASELNKPSMGDAQGLVSTVRYTGSATAAGDEHIIGVKTTVEPGAIFTATAGTPVGTVLPYTGGANLSYRGEGRFLINTSRAVYSTGTISNISTAAPPVVTGMGTSWLSLGSGAQTDLFFAMDQDTTDYTYRLVAQIASIDSDTQITLTFTAAGTSVSWPVAFSAYSTFTYKIFKGSTITRVNDLTMELVSAANFQNGDSIESPAGNNPGLVGCRAVYSLPFPSSYASAGLTLTNQSATTAPTYAMIVGGKHQYGLVFDGQVDLSGLRFNAAVGGTGAGTGPIIDYRDSAHSAATPILIRLLNSAGSNTDFSYNRVNSAWTIADNFNIGSQTGSNLTVTGASQAAPSSSNGIVKIYGSATNFIVIGTLNLAPFGCYISTNTYPLLLQTSVADSAVGIGTTAPDRRLEINHSTGLCLRLTYNDNNGSAANYCDLLTTSNGNFTITPSGGLIQLSGNTSSFPALKRNGTAIDVRLADDSAYGNLSAGIIVGNSTSALALAIGGITTPQLQVDCSAASVATGIKITGAASGSGVAVAAMGGTNESISVTPKGTGKVIISTSGNGYKQRWDNTTVAAEMYIGADASIGTTTSNSFSLFTNNTDRITISNAGAIRLVPLTTNGVLTTTGGNGTLAVVAGGFTSRLTQFYTNAGNVTATGETDLYSYTLAAGKLATNGDTVSGFYSGSTAASATATRQIRIYFGGTVLFDTSTLTTTAGATWCVDFSIIRVDASTVRFSFTFALSSATTDIITVNEQGGYTLANTQVIKITGQSAGVGEANNDIIAKLGALNHTSAT